MALSEASNRPRTEATRITKTSLPVTNKPAPVARLLKPIQGVLDQLSNQIGGAVALRSAEVKVSIAEVRLERARDELHTAISNLNPFRPSSMQEVRDALGNVREAEADLKEAKLELKVAQAQDRLDNIGTGFGSAVATFVARAELELAQRELQDFRIERVLEKSPTLQAAIAELEANGWTIQDGTPGGGSFANSGTQTITIDPNLRDDPERYAQVLAHEVGHAVAGPPPFTPIGSLSRDEFVEANTNAQLTGEGYATLYNAEIRAEILANGGPDIGVAGRQSADYISIYEQVEAGTLTEAEAAEQIGQLFGSGEITSNTGENYRDYYAGFYEDFYDNNT